MGRDVSNTFKQAVFAQETGEVYLLLVTIEHADLEAPIYFVNNPVDVVSRGVTFLACAFEVTLPQDKDGEPPRAEVSIDNVDQSIVRTIRSLSSAPYMTAEVIAASAPDIVEASFKRMKLSDVTYTKQSVSGTLSHEDIMSEPYPGDMFQPSAFTGLFTR